MRIKYKMRKKELQPEKRYRHDNPRIPFSQEDALAEEEMLTKDDEI